MEIRKELRNRPLLTEIFADLNEFIPSPDSTYVFGTSVEERSAHSGEWEAKSKDVEFARIAQQTPSTFEVQIQDITRRISLRSGKQLQDLCNGFKSKTIYLDITGLGHHIWAPLLKAALSTSKEVKAVYVEPLDYRYSATPTEGAIFDLSSRISGISPIPGFAYLGESGNNTVRFIPLLGFEGTRFKYLMEQVQPAKVDPIIGVPGFRPEYPFHAYQGNQLPLLENGNWKNVRYAIANCPFSLFNVLEDIAEDYPRDLLKIAPIGTKPHALGAVLFTLISPRPIELVYDHPIRKEGRTAGAARALVYHVSALLPSTR